MKKIYKTQDEVLSQEQLIMLILAWVGGLTGAYLINSFIPVVTCVVTQVVFIAYMFYAEYRYTCIKPKEE